MAPPTWATPEQTAFLQTWMPAFIQRQAEGKLPSFWPSMAEAWFLKYPEYIPPAPPLPNDGLPLSDEDQEELAKAERARRKKALSRRRGQLENWFRNHSKKVGAPAANKTMVERIFRASGDPKRRRLHQAIELFQTRNPELIKAALVEAGYDLLNSGREPDEADDWADKSADTAEASTKRNKSTRMRVRTHVVRELFDQASEAELVAIKEDLEIERAKMEEEALLEAKKPKLLSRTPSERQQGIDALDGVFTDIHKASNLASGWVGMTIFGGPNPRMNGKLTLKVICSGQTPAGNDFEACCVDFDKKVIHPFQDFLRICFGAEDSANWKLPPLLEPAMDTTPVLRVPVMEPSGESVTTTKKPKKKKKSKKSTESKKSEKNKSPAAAAVSDAEEGAESTMEANHSENELLPPISRCASPNVGEDFFDDQSPMDDFDGADAFSPTLNTGTDSPALWSSNVVSPTPPSPWPPGMTAPLDPQEAEAIATRERGGSTNHATMAIDPRLLEHDAPDITPAQPPPGPRPAYRGSGFTPTSDSTRQIYRPSTFFEAFRGSKTPQTAPTAPSRSTLNTTPSPTTQTTPAAPSFDFRSTFNTAASLTTQTMPAAPSFNFRSALNTTSPSTMSPVSSKPSPSSSPLASKSSKGLAAKMIASIVKSHIPGSPASTLPSPSQPATSSTSTHTLTVPLATLTPPPRAPTIPSTQSSPTTSTSSTSPTPPAVPPSPPSFELPGCRPELRPQAPAAKPPTKGARARQRPAPKASSADGVVKAAAAAAAKHKASVGEQSKKKRGRPRKQPLTDITNQIVATGPETATDTTAVTPEATAAPTTTTPDVAVTVPSGPAHIYSITNNNREAACQAAEREKAEAARAAADAVAAQAAKGWTETTVNGATVVTFTSTRVRKAAKHPDGSTVELEAKKVRTANTKKTDASLTKLLERGNKRKATQSSGPKAKKHKT
ncbi:hypothetical protein C8R45DRAFT_1162115 [Mycena sanguinolenta]|nr:hypothetical protein C8R45DRAFT_1162115 [Mycena sanguinolenta]